MSTIRLQEAGDAAIYNLYLLIADKAIPARNDTLGNSLRALEVTAGAPTEALWTARDRYQLRLLRGAIERRPALADTVIGELTLSENGSTVCSFTDRDGTVFVVYKGTGAGEWIDNGEGLSGLPEENTYITYGQDGRELSRRTVRFDLATDQQVEALNHFHRLAAENGWSGDTRIVLSGHSKGGNKAQFITVQSALPDVCYSFDGQGFSPEALAAFRFRHRDKFTVRREKIYSLSAENDYVNVLGERLTPESHIHYFASVGGLHYLEALLDEEGCLRSQCEQGELSRTVETISHELMELPPAVRRYATLGVMNVFQQVLGKGVPVNGDAVSMEETVAGIGVAALPFLGLLHRTGNG